MLELKSGRQAATSSSVSAGSQKNPPPPAIFGSVYVGMPAQELKVVFDTGAGNIILPGKKCASIACMSKKPYDKLLSTATQKVMLDLDEAETVTLEVGSGSVTAGRTSDKVCLGPQETLCAQTSLLEATEMSMTPFSLYPYDGVIGLGMPGLSLAKEYNFMGNLAEAKELQTDRFGVWIAMQTDLVDSEITFGALPEERLGSDILWLPLSTTKTGYWQVSMTDITANLVRLGLCGRTGCQAAFDTGTGVIGGPPGVINGILAALNILEDCTNYDHLPALGFELGGVTMNIEKTEYVQRTTEGCFPQFAAVDMPADEPMILLGTPFLTRYVTIYDRVFLRMGLSYARHKNLPTGETNEEAAKRLMARQAVGKSAADEAEE